MILHPTAEGLTGNVRHREIDELSYLVDSKNGNDVGVRQLGGGARLAEEALTQVCFAREFLRQDLQSHRPVQPHLLGEVHDSHATPAKLGLQGVLPGESLLKREEPRIERLLP